jgi:hypothetical protein
MRLITEVTESVDFIIEKDEEGKKSHYIKGVFMQAEQKNRNGRFYPVGVLRNEVKRYNKEYVEKNRAFGELGHPDGPTINLDRVSHMIKDIQEDGNNNFIGKAKIMDTPYGKIVKNLIDEGANLGVSSRGMGSLKPGKTDGMQVVQDDYHLATAADIVADPSAPNAFVQGIMEGKEWVWNNGLIQERDISEYKQEIEKEHRARLEESKLRVFGDFLLKLQK